MSGLSIQSRLKTAKPGYLVRLSGLCTGSPEIYLRAEPGLQEFSDRFLSKNRRIALLQFNSRPKIQPPNLATRKSVSQKLSPFMTVRQGWYPDSL